METPGIPTETPGTPPSPTPPPPEPNPTPPPPPQGPSRALAALTELAGILRPHWPTLSTRARLEGPVCEGEGGEGGSGEGEGGEGGSGEGGQASAGQATADEWKPPTREEWDALQKANAEAQKDARKARKAAEEAARKKAEEEGNHEELAKQARAEADRVKGLVVNAARRSAVTEVATTLGFRNPAIAGRLIDTADVDVDVDLDGEEPKAEVAAAGRSLIETRLTEALNADPYLKRDGAGRQLPGAGEGNQTGEGGGHQELNRRIRSAAGRG